MLADKDVPGVVGALKGAIDIWIAASVDGPRALGDSALASRAATRGVHMRAGGPVEAAMRAAALDARPGDRVVVFGSFHTVGPALEQLVHGV
jgi:dihydrofolate synthase/folylpolyglutamate synthase